MSKAIDDVLAERRRQVEAEGWSPEHDDAHTDFSLAKAACIYGVGATLEGPDRAVMDEFGASGTPGWVRELWPWDHKWFKPTDRRRDLVKAAALLIAEIERIDRADGRTATPSAQPVQDTWFTDRALPVLAMSADVESDRVLKLHFRRPVTDDDRKSLCDALNMHQAAITAKGQINE